MLQETLQYLDDNTLATAKALVLTQNANTLIVCILFHKKNFESKIIGPESLADLKFYKNMLLVFYTRHSENLQNAAITLDTLIEQYYLAEGYINYILDNFLHDNNN